MNTTIDITTTNNPTMEELRADAILINTTGNWNGTPSNVISMHTFPSMFLLRQLYHAAKAEGHKVTIWKLYRRDGWAFWVRHVMGKEYDLRDDMWAMEGVGRFVDIDRNSDRLDKAFNAVCGKGYTPYSPEEMLAKADAVRRLAEDLTNPKDLEKGEVIRHWLNASNDYRVSYTVRIGDTGYSYNGYHWCVALEIEEKQNN